MGFFLACGPGCSDQPSLSLSLRDAIVSKTYVLNLSPGGGGTLIYALLRKRLVVNIFSSSGPLSSPLNRCHPLHVIPFEVGASVIAWICHRLQVLISVHRYLSAFACSSLELTLIWHALLFYGRVALSAPGWEIRWEICMRDLGGRFV